MADVLLRRFQPLHLKLERVGPFRSAFELPLTGAKGQPANFFLLVSKNGFGKTTILEAIYSLMAGLALPGWSFFSVADGSLAHDLHPDLLAGGQAQLDIRVELESGGKSTSAVLSLFVGGERPPRTLTPSLLEEAQVDRWLPLRLMLTGPGAFSYSFVDPDMREVISPLINAIRNGNEDGRRFIPNGESLLLPTVLYFTADRRISQPTARNRAIQQPNLAYGPAQKFTTDGDTWETSLDGLLVWYEWLGDGLFEQARDMVNSMLFSDGRKRMVGIDRHNLGAVIEVEQEDGTCYRHGLDRLSHGERSLMHLLVRSAYHRTGSTILMIDEMETHLHPKWQHRLMTMLKEWIRLWPDLTVIATTHQPEMMDAFAFEQSEDGLVKGGHLIEVGDL